VRATPFKAARFPRTRVRGCSSAPRSGAPKRGQPLNAAAYAHAPECPHEAARCVRLTNNERIHHDR
jgi:hypothetical protein